MTVLLLISEWTEDIGVAYHQIFGPAVGNKMLHKKETERLKTMHPKLKYFSYTKLRNKINANVQRVKRQLKKKVINWFNV